MKFFIIALFIISVNFGLSIMSQADVFCLEQCSGGCMRYNISAREMQCDTNWSVVAAGMSPDPGLTKSLNALNGTTGNFGANMFSDILLLAPILGAFLGILVSSVTGVATLLINMHIPPYFAIPIQLILDFVMVWSLIQFFSGRSGKVIEAAIIPGLSPSILLEKERAE